MLGCAELLLMAVWGGYDRAAALLKTAFAFLLVLNGIPFGLLIADLGPASSSHRGPGRLAVVAVLVLGVGMALPLVLLAGGEPGRTVPAVILLLLQFGGPLYGRDAPAQARRAFRRGRRVGSRPRCSRRLLPLVAAGIPTSLAGASTRPRSLSAWRAFCSVMMWADHERRAGSVSDRSDQ